MEIKKGDRFRCIRPDLDNYTFDNIYTSDREGCITNRNGDISVSWGYVEDKSFYTFFKKMPEAEDSATSPSHYKTYDMEAIEMMIRIWGKQRVAEWCEITAFKYRCRVGMKGDVQQDLKKEAYYLAKWKELRDGE